MFYDGCEVEAAAPRVAGIAALTQPRGRSLHVGLNAVDPGSYEGWDGRLKACENDAFAMRDICKASGLETSYVLTKRATAGEVLRRIEAAAASLEAGDLFVVTFSCHGGQVEDPWGKYGRASTLCMYDREVVSHELYQLWGKFPPGVRILVTADACHSGTVARERPHAAQKVMPAGVQQAVHAQTAGFMRSLISSFRAEVPPPPAAGVIQLGACQDNQLAYDGKVNGLFTQHVLQAWNRRKFQGGHPLFYRKVLEGMPPEQTPSYLELGEVRPAFRLGKPFVL